eukprot:9967351-Ditylum_brightwellii.AAC.1
MSAWYYFDRPCNLVFHDLTTIQTPPKNLQSLLGLGLKFCPAPRYITHRTSNTLPCFDRDVQLKTYFSDAEDYEYSPKMYAKVNFVPPDVKLPKEILHRSTAFQNTITFFFKKRRGQNNLLPQQ